MKTLNRIIITLVLLASLPRLDAADARASIPFGEFKDGDPVERDAALSALQIRWRRLSETDTEAPEYVGKVKNFDTWLKLSEQTLRQRLAIDRQLLMNELQFLKLQSLWVKPYLP